MISHQIARLIANQLLFLEFCDDDILDPDSALKVMEGLVADITAINRAFLGELIAAFAVIAAEYEDEETAEFVRDIPYAYSLEDALAAEDPAMLAELLARRDADERNSPEQNGSTMP